MLMCYCFWGRVEETFERDRVTDWGKGLHRVYYDRTAFEHKVELKKVDSDAGGRMRVKRYTLYVSFLSFFSPFCLFG